MIESQYLGSPPGWELTEKSNLEKQREYNSFLLLHILQLQYLVEKFPVYTPYFYYPSLDDETKLSEN